jgi:sulfate permease, SulP family
VSTVSLWLAGVNPDLLKVIERSSLGSALGRERMFFNLPKALERFQGAGGEDGRGQ